MKDKYPDDLCELYSDVALHLMTLDMAQDRPAWCAWLAERVLTGLPNHNAYQLAHGAGMADPDDRVANDVIGTFVWADTDGQMAFHFGTLLRDTCSALRKHKLPPYSREDEVIALHKILHVRAK